MSLSTFLNGREPAQLRGLLWLALSDTGVIQQRASTSDSGGGASTSWAAAGTVPCRVDPVGAGRMSRVTGGQIDERSTHMITAPPGTSVNVTDRVVVANRGTFEVTAVETTTAEQAHSFEVIQIS